MSLVIEFPDTAKPEGEVGWNCSKSVFSNNNPGLRVATDFSRWNDCAGSIGKAAGAARSTVPPRQSAPLGFAIPDRSPTLRNYQ